MKEGEELFDALADTKIQYGMISYCKEKEK